MKLSSAEGAKLLKKLKSEFDALKSKESISSTFLASVGENPESVRPKYDYKEVKADLDGLALKIRKLKHAINLFNTTTVIPEYNITIDEMLVLIPQLSAKKQKLSEMALRLPKAREEQGYGRASNIIDYRYANYDIDEVNKDLLCKKFMSAMIDRSFVAAVENIFSIFDASAESSIKFSPTQTVQNLVIIVNIIVSVCTAKHITKSVKGDFFKTGILKFHFNRLEIS